MIEIHNRWNGSLLWAGASLSDLPTGADLSAADLRGLDLRGLDLRKYNLQGADFRKTKLLGATIDWGNHDLISELAARHAGQDIEKIKVAALPLLCRDRCWREFAMLGVSRDKMVDWALNTLTMYVTLDDGAPKLVLRRLKQLRKKEQKK